MPLIEPPDSVLDLPVTDDDENFYPIPIDDDPTLLGPDEEPTYELPDDEADYSWPSEELLVNEAASRLVDTGEIEEFDSLTSSVDLVNADDLIYAADAATGQAISDTLATVPTFGGAADYQDVQSDESSSKSLRVKISQMPDVGSKQYVEFVVMPTIQEQHSATYKSVEIAHHPGEILKYVNTSARSWTITAQLISRNPTEASNNLEDINIIRSWLMPFYGVGTSEDPIIEKYLGAPPPILTLEAYGGRMVGPVPCVLSDYGWSFPNDCDYITTNSGEAFPVVVSVTLTLKESYSPAEYTSFNLAEYKRGDMSGAFTGKGVYSNMSKSNISTPNANDLVDESASAIESNSTLTNQDISNKIMRNSAQQDNTNQ